jgi:hypothetical protein
MVQDCHWQDGWQGELVLSNLSIKEKQNEEASAVCQRRVWRDRY